MRVKFKGTKMRSFWFMRNDNLVIFADTDSDITPEIAKEYGFNLISMPYMIDDKEIYPYIDFEEFDYKTFYNSLRKGTLPSTFALNVEQYKGFFEPFFKDGKDILYVHFATVMSGSFNAMRLAVEELSQKYPERKFYEIDTKGITILAYIQAIQIGRMYKEGKSVEEMLKWAEEETQKYAIFFYADNLTFFGRSGRVSKFSAVMGNMIDIHPIIHMDSTGRMVSLSKARGKKNSVNKIMAYIDEIQDNIQDYDIVIGHTDCQDIADLFIKLLKEKYGENLRIDCHLVNPTAGAHCGPDAIGVTFHARCRYDSIERSQN